MKINLFKPATLLLAMTLLFSGFAIPVSAKGESPDIGKNFSPLTLTTVCTDNPIVSRKWIVHNPNAKDVDYNYKVEGSTLEKTKTVKGNSDQEIDIDTEGTNILDIMVGGVIQANLASVGAACAVSLPTAIPAPSTTPTVEFEGEKLVGTSDLLSVWLVSNGSLIIKTKLANNETGTGKWNFNLGGKTYSVEGNESISYTVAGAPVGTYQISAQFVPITGVSSKLAAVTVSVPTPAPTAESVGGKLVGTSDLLSVWLVPNGSLIIKTKLPNNETGTGKWNFNLGGKTYSVEGNESISYTVASAPVGTYQISAQFVPITGVSSKLAAVTVSVPTPAPTAESVSGKLVGTSDLLSVWSVPNGSLIIKAKLPNNETGTGTWNFNLGGKTYNVKGNESISYTVANAPVGTYLISAQFAPTTGVPPTKLAAVTVSVPTLTGGKLPNTASPWYNFLLMGAILAFVGAVVWRVRKVYE